MVPEQGEHKSGLNITFALLALLPETWQVIEAHKRKLNKLHQRGLQRILADHWWEKVTNGDVTKDWLTDCRDNDLRERAEVAWACCMGVKKPYAYTSP